MMPAPDDPRNALAGILGRGETDQRGTRAFRLLQEAHRHLGDDAQKPLRTRDDAEQIVAGRIEMAAAKPQDLAAHQNQFTAEHIVGGDAVFQAVNAARIFRHIAADGAGNLRRRIGRIIEARMIDRLRDRKIGDAWLDHRHPVLEIDGADALELGHAEQNAVAQRQRATGQRCPCPARHHLDAFAMAIGQHGGDLLGGLRQHHDHRERPIGGEAVAFVGPHGLFGRDHPLARHDAFERRDDLGAARKHRVVGLGHYNSHSIFPEV